MKTAGDAIKALKKTWKTTADWATGKTAARRAETYRKDMNQWERMQKKIANGTATPAQAAKWRDIKQPKLQHTHSVGGVAAGTLLTGATVASMIPSHAKHYEAQARQNIDRYS